MAGIKIDFISDVGKFLSGTKDIESALDKVSDALDDVAKDADDAGKKLGDGISDGADKAADSAKDLDKGFKDSLDTVKDEAQDAGRKLGSELEDGSKDASDAGDKMERKFRDSFDAVKTDSKATGDRVGTDIKDGFRKAEDAADEFKDEAQQTSREAAASFTGDFEDVADAIQETLANAFVGFGPAGAVAGMAAAAGVGILIATLQNSSEKAAEAKDRIIDLANEIREVGGDVEDVDWGAIFQDFANQIADAKSWFEPWQDASRTNVEVIAADAERLGLNFQALFQGMAGDSEAGTRALEEINGKLAEAEAEYQRLVNNGVAPATAALLTNRDALQEQREKVEEGIGSTEGAITIAELHEEAIEGSTAAIDAFNEAQEKRLELLKTEAEINMSVAEAEAAWAEAVMESGKVLEEVNSKIDRTSEATIAATDAVTEGGAGWDLYTEAGQLANDASIDLAKSGWDVIEAAREQGATTEELRAKTQTARDEFVRQVMQLGLTSEAANKLADDYGLVPDEVATTAQFDKAEANRKIDETKAKVDSIPAYKQVTIDANAYFSSSGAGAADAWRLLSGRNSGGQIPGAASGVFVNGPGSDIEDRVPYMLSPGEFVLDKQAVDQIGVGRLQQANEGMGRSGRASLTAVIPSADAIGAAVARALQGMSIRIEETDYLANSAAARINVALAQGV